MGATARQIRDYLQGWNALKIVGSRRSTSGTPADFIRRAERVIAAANRLSPVSKPRGFVVKAKTWDAYTAWKLAQPNPRLW